MLTRRVRRWSSGDGAGGGGGAFAARGAVWRFAVFGSMGRCACSYVYNGPSNRIRFGGSRGFPARGPCGRCDWYPLMSRSPHSSGDRAPPSGGGSAGSNPAGGASSRAGFSRAGLRVRGNVRCHAWSRRATVRRCGTVPALPGRSRWSWLVLGQGVGHAGDPEVFEAFGVAWLAHTDPGLPLRPHLVAGPGWPPVMRTAPRPASDVWRSRGVRC